MRGNSGEGRRREMKNPLRSPVVPFLILSFSVISMDAEPAWGLCASVPNVNSINLKPRGLNQMGYECRAHLHQEIKNIKKGVADDPSLLRVPSLKNISQELTQLEQEILQIPAWNMEKRTATADEMKSFREGYTRLVPKIQEHIQRIKTEIDKYTTQKNKAPQTQTSPGGK